MCFTNRSTALRILKKGRSLGKPTKRFAYNACPNPESRVGCFVKRDLDNADATYLESKSKSYKRRGERKKVGAAAAVAVAAGPGR